MKLREVGQSQCEAFEKCPVLWYHSYLMGSRGWGYSPISDPIPLLWGSIGHEGLRSWYGHLRLGCPPLDAIEPALAEMITYRSNRLAKASAAGLPVGPPDDDPRSNLDLADAFIHGYAQYYIDDATWDIICVEKEFSIPPEIFFPPEIINGVISHTGLPLSEFPAIRGTIDLVVREPSGLTVIDHKFNSSIDTDLNWGTTHWKQPLLYSRAASIIFNQPIANYVHNQIRKPAPGMKPRLDPETQQYESASEFQQRLSREYADYPDYLAAYPNRKKGYFHRHWLLNPQYNEGRWLWELAYEHAMMAKLASSLPDKSEWTMPPPWFPRRDSRSGCKLYAKPCSFATLCDYGYTPATKAMFVEKDEPHP